MTQKMLFDHLYRYTRLIAGGEIRRFVMRKPVVPDDVLQATIEVVSRMKHHKRADAGWVELHVETTRGQDETVLEFDSRILFETSPN